MPRVAEPHGTPSPSKEAVQERVQLSVFRHPFDSSHLSAGAWSAKNRAGVEGLRSRRTMQAPHSESSEPSFVPGYLILLASFGSHRRQA